MTMNPPKLNNRADTFFVCHFTASAAVALLWLAQITDVPDFIAGLGAGLIVASIIAMFLTRASDEYTLATWHAGTSAGFAVIVLFLLLGALTPGVSAFGNMGPYTAELSAMSAYLVVVAVRRWQARA